MFAGPNGSGKSRLKEYLNSDLLYVYVNADEIEKSLKKDMSVNFSEFRINVNSQELVEFIRQSVWLNQVRPDIRNVSIRLSNDVMHFKDVDICQCLILVDRFP